MDHNMETKKQVVRVAGRLKEIVTLHDEKGNILHRMVSPLMVEFYPRDLIQVIVGASILAIPVAFTEETWRLGESLPFYKVLGIAILSLFFITAFVYYNYYREHFKEHWHECIKRVFSTYIISLLLVALILTIIEQAPWATDHILAIKRVMLVAFPASMSAAVADMIK